MSDKLYIQSKPEVASIDDIATYVSELDSYRLAEFLNELGRQYWMMTANKSFAENVRAELNTHAYTFLNDMREVNDE